MIERVFILKRTDLFKELPSEVLASFANHLDEIYVGERETVIKCYQRPDENKLRMALERRNQYPKGVPTGTHPGFGANEEPRLMP